MHERVRTLAEPRFYLHLLGRMATELWLTGADDYTHAPDAGGAVGEEARHGLPPLSASAPRPQLPAGLVHFIYGHYYLQDPNEVENARTNELGKVPIRAREDVELSLALRAANRGKGYPEPGWEVVGREADGVHARKAGITLFLSESDIVGARELPEVGQTIVVRFPNARPYVNAGFYTAIGDRGPATPEAGRQLLRIYFNVRPEGAPALVEQLTGTLGAELSQFTLKVLNNPKFYTRPDTAVVYMLQEDYAHARPVLRDVVRSLGEWLGERTPTLAYPIARGVAVAEEPIASGMVRPSFGQHRCNLIATGLARAFADGVDTARGRMSYILRELEAAGVEPARPYVNLGSEGCYAPLEQPDSA